MSISLSPASISSGRASTGSVATAGSADVTVTISPAMPDTNFTASAQVELDEAGGSLRVLRIRSKTTTTVVVNVINDALTSKTGVVHVMAVHD